ncbi:iron-sulfur cluster assembly 1 homolog, mitochondrial-like [Anneissia japonica]|uniref:iron-sulfur cluster assembly 1 homolog, mitochondrial-like n=1 Tax=Anneissia japonica TaxID=1529436 RepID=UPI001425871E|nr:iron-sulfur cluster assembly 1 homolog, mitochondrial-like [Anneissia japonica]
MASRISATVRAVSRKRSIPRKAAIVLTQAAVNKVRTLLEQRPDMEALRIGLKTRGCNGLSYTLDYTNEKKKFDEIVEQGGAKIYIDSKAQLGILGTELDYIEEILSSGFVFNNPNIKGTCGCGESFNV